MDNASQTINQKSISRIVIEGLFGRYSYNIPDDNTNYANLSNLLILYGENGTGKTKILNLIYHMLSPVRRGGHRTYIARQPFRKFSVQLTNGVCITAERKGHNLNGDFEWSVSKQNDTIARVLLKADEEKDIPSKLPDDVEIEHEKIIKILEGLDIQLFFLSDDRKILSKALTTEEDKEELVMLETEEPTAPVIQRVLRRRSKSEGLPLNEAIGNLVTWIRNQVYAGSSLGETNASTIYSGVVKSIAESHPTRESVTIAKVRDLLTTMDKLFMMNKDFSNLGLIPPLNFEEMARVIRPIREKKTRTILYDVTKPYVDGLMARFKALEGIKNLINTFLHNINDFYIDKTVSFDLSKGIRITSSQGQELAPDMLSSGEKQLLLLFCHTMVASEKSSIVIIDEPEISLNVTWQRQLIRALLECSGSKDFQLVLATHSMELLAQYSRNVVKLVNLASGLKK